MESGEDRSIVWGIVVSTGDEAELLVSRGPDQAFDGISVRKGIDVSSCLEHLSIMQSGEAIARLTPG